VVLTTAISFRGYCSLTLKKEKLMSVHWKHLFDIDFSSDLNIYWVIDTRDFHVNSISDHYMNIPDLPKSHELQTLLNYTERFFSNADEIKNILTDLYYRSGGEGEWRFISFKNQSKKKTDDWELKYLFVFRTDHGLLICDKDKNPLRKDLFQEQIDEELLAHQ
jgi:hypothetical protein